MMNTRLHGFACAALALFFSAHDCSAAIMKLDLGGTTTAPDVSYSGTVLSTPSDGDLATTGAQDTNILFTDFLAGMGSTSGSYTLNGLTATSPTTVTPLPGGILFATQILSGGNFQVYNSANIKLLDVDLTSSTSILSGVLNGSSSTGAVISVSNGTVVGGTLAPLINANSISFSLTLSNISGGGLAVGGGFLLPFTAAATKEIGGTGVVVPEPAAALMLALGSVIAPMMRRRRLA